MVLSLKCAIGFPGIDMSDETTRPNYHYGGFLRQNNPDSEPKCEPAQTRLIYQRTIMEVVHSYGPTHDFEYTIDPPTNYPDVRSFKRKFALVIAGPNTSMESDPWNII